MFYWNERILQVRKKRSNGVDKTELAIPTGMNQTDLVSNYRNPCQITDEPGNEQSSQHCIRIYNHSFMEPIKSFCEQVNQYDMLSDQRILQVGIGDWLMIRMPSFLFFFGYQDHTKLNKMEDEHPLMCPNLLS